MGTGMNLTKKEAKKLLTDIDKKWRKFMFSGASFGKNKYTTVLGFQIKPNTYTKDFDTVTKILQKYFDGVDKL